MQLVRSSEIPFLERKDKPRGGLFRQRRLLEGIPSTPGNYLLQNVETAGDFISPRHKHNFEQYRFQIRGTFDFGRDGTMSPGVVGYFPEGTPYGPQTSSEDSLTLVLQFGGPSLNGYMSEDELAKSVVALRQNGVFKDGIYTQNKSTNGRKNKDAYEACWESHNKRELNYPAMRFQAPVLVNPDNFPWHPVQNELGVSQRLLLGGSYTDVGFLSVEADAEHVALGRRLFYVLSGNGVMENNSWGPETAIELAAGEQGTFHAHTQSEILFMGLPILH